VRARVGFNEAEGYLLNPTYPQLADSKLDMVVAGTADAVLMVESQADQLTEDQMLGAVLYAHQEMQVVIKAIQELVAEAGKPSWNWEPPPVNEELLAAVEGQVKSDLGEAYRITEKAERYARVGEIREACVRPPWRSRAARAPTRSRTTSRRSRRTSCASASWPARRASTAATPHRAPHRLRSRRAAQGPRLGAVHPR
jgi:polyribonucleotide nucleotidyltransferase